jgi:hypothetical protein
LLYQLSYVGFQAPRAALRAAVIAKAVGIFYSFNPQSSSGAVSLKAVTGIYTKNGTLTAKCAPRWVARWRATKRKK